MTREQRVITLGSDSNDSTWRSRSESGQTPDTSGGPNHGRTVPPPLNVVNADQLGTTPTIGELRLQLEDSLPVFVVVAFLTWPASSRRNLFRMLAALSQYLIRANELQEYTDGLEFAVGQLVGDADIEQCERGRQAANEATAILHPGSIVPAASRIASQLRALGVRGVNANRIQAEIRDLVATLAPPTSPTATRVIDSVHGAPVPHDLVVPEGWQISSSGIYLHGRQVCAIPLVITHRFVDVATNEESLQVAMLRSGEWARCRVARSRLASLQQFRTLAAVGIPVHSGNARYLLQYLVDFDADNSNRIPVVQTSTRLGWHNDDEVFVLPDVTISAETYLDPAPEGSQNSSRRMDGLIHLPSNAVAEQIMSGFRTAGTLDGWLDAVRELQPFRRAQFVFYAGFAPALLRILHISNFCMDVAGGTSSGKTTILRTVGSIWGNASDAADSLLFSWDSTATFREELLGALNGVPVLLDETRLIGDNRELARSIFSLVQGRSRGRSAQRGQRAESFETVAFLTGEVPLCSIATQGGISARSVKLWGGVFGPPSHETAQAIRRLSDGIRDNFGFAGPMFVRNVLRHRDHWSWLRDEFARRRSEFEQRAGNNAVLQRLSTPLAAISIAAWVAHDSLALPWPYGEPVNEIWNELARESADADRARAALECAVEWARNHPSRFYGRLPSGSQPTGGWVGRWVDADEWIGFRPENLKHVLARASAGFEFDAIIRIWAEREWILSDPASGKRRHRGRMGENSGAWLIAIPYRVIAMIESAEG